MVLEGLQDFLARIGLGDPAVRFIAFGAATAGLAWTLKPALMFSGGKPKPFGDNAKGGTYVTWWIAAIAVGALFTLFL